MINQVDDSNLEEQLRSCKHLVEDSEFERTRHKVVNYTVEDLIETVVNSKHDHFFNNSKCAAKVNLAAEFILENKENGSFRYFYAHEKITQLDRPKLACTKDNLMKSKQLSTKLTSSTRVVESRLTQSRDFTGRQS